MIDEERTYGKTMNKQEYREWFYKYLGDVEQEMDGDCDSPILNVPKLFSFWKWAIFLSIATVVALVIAICFNYICQIEEQWVSSLFANLAMGLIASIIILCFTNARERNITYLTDIIPLLRKRYEDLSVAIYYDSASFSIASQRGDSSIYYDCWHRFSNTITVAFEFYKLLCNTAKYKPAYLTKYMQDDREIHEKLIEMDERIVTNLNNKNKDKDLMEIEKDTICIMNYFGLGILDVINHYTNDLEARLFKFKYNKKNKTPTMVKNEERDKIWEKQRKQKEKNGLRGASVNEIWDNGLVKEKTDDKNSKTHA